jgi:hypothetical protein
MAYKWFRKMGLAILVVFTSVYCFNGKASADDAQVKGRGIPIIVLSDVYKYNSGGVPLLGYIVQRTESNDSVKFLICSSGNTISVSFKSLEQVKTKCPNSTTGEGLWSAWVVSSGQLVASGKPDASPDANATPWKEDAFKPIDIDAFPTAYREALGRVKSGHIAAYSFPSEDGAMALAIVPHY